ncbi:MAG: OmpH family outer membrane protein [Planctomycetota bacterium]
MQMKERVAVYGGIAVAIVLAAGYRGPGNLAAASGETPQVRSADLKIGTCDVLAISEKFMQSEKYSTIMNITKTTLDKTLQPLKDEVEGLGTKLQALPREGAEFKNGYATYSQKVEEYKQRLQQNDNALREQQVRNLGEAYNIVITTADAVGSKLGYTHVIASRPVGKPAEFGHLDPLIEILAHPLIKGAEGADITAEVIKELKLDVAPPAGPAPAVPPVPAVPVPETKSPETKPPEKK